MIPPDILSTSSYPDIMVNTPRRFIHILELTVPSNNVMGLNKVRSRKQDKAAYNILLMTLKKVGLPFTTLQIGPTIFYQSSHISMPQEQAHAANANLLDTVKICIMFTSDLHGSQVDKLVQYTDLYYLTLSQLPSLLSQLRLDLIFFTSHNLAMHTPLTKCFWMVCMCPRTLVLILL